MTDFFKKIQQILSQEFRIKQVRKPPLWLQAKPTEPFFIKSDKKIFAKSKKLELNFGTLCNERSDRLK